jgi:hypothetical protein
VSDRPADAIAPGAPIAPKVRLRKGRRKKAAPGPQGKPKLPPLDALAAAQEACRHAQEGSVKLAATVDSLREALQTLSIAEWDREEGREVLASELRQMARQALAACGFRVPVVRTRAGKADHDFGKNRGLDGADYD